MKSINPILREIDRLARKGMVVKGVQPAENANRHGVDFRLANGSSATFFFHAGSEKQFNQWFREAFASTTSRRSRASARKITNSG